ncbi:MAG TPA: hypothetical protein DDW86_00610, partial [Clostridiales bacterium]|nr:hypothetical protein [Clostridiales bacterium]
GFMEYLTLQNTRLNLVMRMADIISNGIHFNIWKYIDDKGDRHSFLPDKISDHGTTEKQDQK